MTTSSTVVLGVICALILLVAVLFFRSVKGKLSKPGAALGNLMAGGVPPFRITLRPEAAPAWKARKKLAALSTELEALGYSSCGDFIIPEMPGINLRGFCHDSHAVLAALYEHPREGLLLDLMRLYMDHRQILCTTAPAYGLEDPPNKHSIRFIKATDVQTIHRTLLVEAGGQKPVALTPRLFPVLFTTAYETEMDWRIERGGVSPEEVRGAALAGGQDEPDDAAVERVQRQWRRAIEAHCTQEVTEAFLQSGQISAAQWESLRDQIRVVHKGTDFDELFNTVADYVASAQQAARQKSGGDFNHAAARSNALTQLTQGLGGQSAFPANIAAAFAALPDEHRPQLLGTVEHPRQGSLYLLNGVKS